jgi:hypothetical protein
MQANEVRDAFVFQGDPGHLFLRRVADPDKEGSCAIALRQGIEVPAAGMLDRQFALDDLGRVDRVGGLRGGARDDRVQAGCDRHGLARLARMSPDSGQCARE